MQDRNPNEAQLSSQIPFQIAVILTALIIVFAVLIWTGILHMSPSPYEVSDTGTPKVFNIADFGTYVSGIFTSLSFIWLVVNAIQQREDLKLQRKEMIENNKHQKEQAKQLTDTTEINRINSDMQREIYANESITPQLKTIYFFLQLKARAVKILIRPDLKDIEMQEISNIFHNINSNNNVINILEVKSSDELSMREFAEYHKDNDIKIISYIRYTADILISNTQKINKVKRTVPNAFLSFRRRETIEELVVLFNYFNRSLDWLEPNYARTLRNFYKLDELMLCFEILRDIKIEQLN